MSKLIPDYVFDSIYDITPEVLTAHAAFWSIWTVQWHPTRLLCRPIRCTPSLTG